nr:uncharacterized protein LOC124811886 [Hydra vulgaris]
MHELNFNAPLFVKSHKTIGLLNEEEGESLHGGVNQELRQLHSVRNQEQKLRLVLKRFELHSKADRKLQAAKVRKCVVCSEHGKKSFYRKEISSNVLQQLRKHYSFSHHKEFCLSGERMGYNIVLTACTKSVNTTLRTNHWTN